MGPSMYKVPFAMALVSPEDRLVHVQTGCRDYLHDIIKIHVNGKKIDKNQFGVSSYYREGPKAPDVCMDKLRLLISLSEKFSEYMRNAMRTLNVIEHYAGIVPSSYMEVNYPMKGKHYLIEGSAEYVHNPHLLSALTFIIRFITKNSLAEEFDSAEAFIGKIDKMWEDMRLNVYSDITIAGKCKDKLLKVLKDRKQLFAGVKQEHFYPKSASESYHAQGGIACLCQGHTHNEVVNERVLAL
jgi:hypothetical protein